jgi:hypothetical protein
MRDDSSRTTRCWMHNLTRHRDKHPIPGSFGTSWQIPPAHLTRSAEVPGGRIRDRHLLRSDVKARQSGISDCRL